MNERFHHHRRTATTHSRFLVGVGLLLLLNLLVDTAVGDANVASSLAPLSWSGDIGIATTTADQGEGRWAPPGIAMLPDASGGLYIGWEDFWWASVFVQRLSANGVPLWGTGGRAVAPYYYQYTPRMISDGTGGIILAWLDGRLGWCTPDFAAECNIFAQRFNANGSSLWAAGGMTVTAALDNQGLSGIGMASDGASGAILAWEDERRTDPWRIYAQLISKSGHAAWTKDGIPISPPATTYQGDASVAPLAVSDGAGGAVIAWFNEQIADTSVGVPISAQRINSSGHLLWATAGITVGIPMRYEYAMTSDGAGGAILAWPGKGQDGFDDVFVQRIDSSGHILWDPAGINLTNAPLLQLNPDIASDGAGGAIVVWQDGRNDPGEACMGLVGNCDIYAQRVSANGTILWQANGLPISTARYEQISPRVAVTPGGDVYIAWQDCRIATGLACIPVSKIYVQKVSAAGATQWTSNGVRVSDGSGNQGVFYGSILTPSFSMASQNGDLFLAWPDGRNGQCEYAANTQCDLYGHELPAGYQPPVTPPAYDSHLPLILR